MQSGSDSVLKSMNREYVPHRTHSLCLQTLKREIPEVSSGSTFILRVSRRDRSGLPKDDGVHPSSPIR